MALFHYLWSRVAANNSAADAQINWAEGQAPSSVNDSARAMMASAAGFRDDIAGAILTTGTSTAYVVASYQIFNSLANMSGQVIAFTPHATCGATVTLNVDGLGVKALRTSPGVELQAGTLVAGTPYTATYNNTDSAWYLHSFYANTFNMPLGGMLDFVGSTVPNSSFVFPIGQAISRTTYATLFALVSTTYGGGDGSTTFNVPDVTGRVTAMKEASATRLTSAVSGVDGATLGSANTAQSKTLVTANLPAYTPTGTFASTQVDVVRSSGLNTFTPQILGSGTLVAPASGSSNITGLTGPLTGVAQGGVSTPVSIVQPTIIVNKILRII